MRTLPARDASLILVGLTPGLSQKTEAARVFADAPHVRSDPRAYSALLRAHVAFKGTMRSHLCNMLDDLGLAASLGLAGSDVLFAEGSSMAAATSALVYPVFTGDELRNFSGAPKGLATIPLFRRMLEELLAPRLAAAPHALIVPLGKAACSGVRFLVDAGRMSQERVLDGFPHPSGANGHRERQFAAARARLAHDLGAWFGTRGAPR